MKKLLLIAVFVLLGLGSLNAQDTLSKGSSLVEVNTGFGDAFQTGNAANTGFAYQSVDGVTIWSIGAEGDYFLIDDLALKIGLGYSDFDGTTSFSYKAGIKYYVASQFPLQIDLTGASGDSFSFFDEKPFWLGLQGGYAWFVADNVSIEPGVRYNVSLNEDFSDEGIFEFRIGFTFHF